MRRTRDQPNCRMIGVGPTGFEWRRSFTLIWLAPELVERVALDVELLPDRGGALEMHERRVFVFFVHDRADVSEVTHDAHQTVLLYTDR